MFVGSVCTHPPYNDKNPPSVFFYLLKSLPLSQIKPFSASCLCDVSQTQALPRLFDWRFSTDWTGVLPYTRPEWAVISPPLFRCRSRCRQEWLLSDWGALMLDIIINIAATEDAVDYACFWRECAPDLPTYIYVRANHSWSSFTSRRSICFFMNLCKSPFLITC